MGFTDLMSQYLPVPKRKIKVGKRSQYSLTPLGKIKTENFAIEKKVAFDVADYLNEHGESSVNEIATGLHANPDTTQEALKWLISQSYVATTEK